MVGLVIVRVEPIGVAVAALISAGAIATVGRRIVVAVQHNKPELLAPVVAYVVAISAMVVAAGGTTALLAIAGALFLASDAILAWNRFVEPMRNGRLLAIVPYHVGQALLVASLAVL